MPSYEDLVAFLASYGIDVPPGTSYADVVAYIQSQGVSIPGFDTAPAPPAPPAPTYVYIPPAPRPIGAPVGSPKPPPPPPDFEIVTYGTGDLPIVNYLPGPAPRPIGAPASSPAGGSMTINGWTTSDGSAISHSDTTDAWFHFYWPLAGEIPNVSWYPEDDRNNPLIWVEANQPGNVQRHPLPGTQITIGGQTLYGAGAGPQSPIGGTPAVVVLTGIPPANTAPPAPAPAPPPVTTSVPPAGTSSTPGSGPASTDGTGQAPLLPTPLQTVGVYLITLDYLPIFTPPANVPPTGTIKVVQSGKQRFANNFDDVTAVLNAGGNVIRADGSGADIQHIQAPASGLPDMYLIDANPINVVLGQGWWPGQMDFITGLVAAGLTFPPTLSTEPNAGGFEISTGMLVAGGVLAFFLFRKRRS